VKFPIQIPEFEDAALANRVGAHWNNLTKPPGSLGQLEDLVTRYALIRGEAFPRLAAKGMYVFCADHGVTAEGVSPFPAEITAQMVRNFLRGGAAINVLCRHYGIQPVIVDCGVMGACADGVEDRKIGPGTANFAQGPAMSREQAECAIGNGIELARAAAGRFDIVGAGEMGIGNTTAASALLCVFTGADPIDAAGRGAGLDDEGIRRKARVIAAALSLNQPCATDPVDALAKIGGFEIATMAGFFLGAAASRMPVMVDGFISSSAALAAIAIEPAVKGALIFAHCSAEKAHRRMIDFIGARPILNLDLRLGEGSAAAMGIGIVESAVKLYREMATFQDLAM
jgi:nicotinate-nucleotide--dimethylbenzimidazole phosphoribosyltransferase